MLDNTLIVYNQYPIPHTVCTINTPYPIQCVQSILYAPYSVYNQYPILHTVCTINTLLLNFYSCCYCVTGPKCIFTNRLRSNITMTMIVKVQYFLTPHNNNYDNIIICLHVPTILVLLHSAHRFSIIESRV